MIVHLETIRREAILPLNLGQAEAACRLLKQAALVEVPGSDVYEQEITAFRPIA